MLEIVFSRKEFQIRDFESYSGGNFVFLGTALGPFSQCLPPTMVTDIFTQPPPPLPSP